MRNKIIIILLILLVVSSAYSGLTRYQYSSEKVFINSMGVITLKQKNMGYFNLSEFLDRILGKLKVPQKYSAKVTIKRYDQNFIPIPETEITFELNDIESKNKIEIIDKLFLGKSFLALETYPNPELIRLSDKSRAGFFHHDHFNNTKQVFDPLTDSIGSIIKKDEVYYFNIFSFDPAKTIKKLPIDKIHGKCSYELIDFRENQFLISVTDNTKVLNPESNIPQYYLAKIKDDRIEYIDLPIDINKPKTMKPRFIGNDIVVYCNTTKLNCLSYYVYEISNQVINVEYEAKVPDVDLYENKLYFDSEKKCFYIVIVYKDGRMICRFKLYDTEASIVSEFSLR